MSPYTSYKLCGVDSDNFVCLLCLETAGTNHLMTRRNIPQECRPKPQGYDSLKLSHFLV